MNKYFTIRKFGFLSAGAILVSGLSSCNKKEKKPNVVYILTDDLGYGDLQCYNENGKIKTPNIDKLASEGMIFTNAHTSSAVSTPTRYGILTGRYNWRSPLKRNVLYGYSKALIDTNRLTVAQLLKDNGYNTAYIGKWHLGWNWGKDSTGKVDFSLPITRNPNDNGFDYAFGHCGSLDMAPYVYVENGKSTAIPDHTVGSKDEYGFFREGLTSPDFVHDSVFHNYVMKAINYIKEEAKKEKPFFLYLPLPAPHTPILPTGEWKGASGLNPYADFVMMIDAYMGKLFKEIEETGEANNTLIIFTSDNGCSPKANFDTLTALGHNPSYVFRGHKADIFEGGHRVPFIVKWPKVVSQGLKSDVNISTVDFMATCADILKLELPDNAAEDSYSILPLLIGKNEEYKRKSTVTHSNDGEFAITEGKWKMIFTAGSGGWSHPNKKDSIIDSLPIFQLYNLENDISESNNLIDSLPEKAEEMRLEMKKLIEDGRSTPGEKQSNEINMWDDGKWTQIEKIVK